MEIIDLRYTIKLDYKQSKFHFLANQVSTTNRAIEEDTIALSVLNLHFLRR